MYLDFDFRPARPHFKIQVQVLLTCVCCRRLSSVCSPTHVWLPIRSRLLIEDGSKHKSIKHVLGFWNSARPAAFQNPNAGFIDLCLLSSYIKCLLLMGPHTCASEKEGGPEGRRGHDEWCDECHILTRWAPNINTMSATYKQQCCLRMALIVFICGTHCVYKWHSSRL